jgi:hypothetical protein
MNRPICEICGVNDAIVYVERPEGTFCYTCDTMVTEIQGSTLAAATKELLINDLKQSPTPMFTLSYLFEFMITEAPLLGATAAAITAGIQGHK